MVDYFDVDPAGNADTTCEVCFIDAAYCECPACDLCGVQGRLACYAKGVKPNHGLVLHEDIKERQSLMSAAVLEEQRQEPLVHFDYLDSLAGQDRMERELERVMSRGRRDVRQFFRPTMPGPQIFTPGNPAGPPLGPRVP